MSEHLKTHERAGEHHSQHTEHHERIKKHHEKAAEKARDLSHEKESIRSEVHEQAVSAEDYTPQTEQQRVIVPHTKADKEHSFNTIMHHVRSNMSKPEQTFSKFIHRPMVEKTSEALGKTIARPSGVAGATVAAFIGLLSIYSIAKFAGFELSGSEMPLLLLAGFGFGLFTEWVFKSVRVLLLPKKS